MVKYEDCFDAYCTVEDKIIDCAAYDIFKAGWVASRVTAATTFAEWWLLEGQFIDPDTADVPWFDKRESLCRDAFDAGCKSLEALNKEKECLVPDSIAMAFDDDWEP